MAGHPTRCCRAQVSGETGSPCTHAALGCPEVISAAVAASFLSQTSMEIGFLRLWHTSAEAPSPKQPVEGFAPEVPFAGNLITKLVGIWGHWLSLEQKFQLWWSRSLSYPLQILLFTNWHFPANLLFSWILFCQLSSTTQMMFNVLHLIINIMYPFFPYGYFLQILLIFSLNLLSDIQQVIKFFSTIFSSYLNMVKSDFQPWKHALSFTGQSVCLKSHHNVAFCASFALCFLNDLVLIHSLVVSAQTSFMSGRSVVHYSL